MSVTTEILNYWFGNIQNGLSPDSKNALWYGGSSETDADISRKFAGVLHEFDGVKLPEWVSTARGKLAAVIVTDQFSRNIHRGKARAFSFDEVALTICLQGLEQDIEDGFSLVEKVFYYHPLEHSENLTYQELCVVKFEELLQATQAEQGYSDEVKSRRLVFVENGLQYAKLHRDIIAQFGRFPHRNAVLGRLPCDEETKWLQEGGNRFGQ